ncbi:MAG: hypothetical protein IJ282_07850 [Lachnospiraceae bacterium]|nr:hypothetical protein [Lachnospiraceae bacterium]
MLNGKLDFLEKVNSDKVVVGYDLGNRYSQISYCFCNSTVPETISQIAGSEQYNIPTVLCKRKGVNQWFYGKEALKYAEENEGTLIDNLLGLAKDGEKILIEGQEFEPLALLTLFIRRSLALLAPIGSLDKIAGLMFTCDDLEQDMVSVLSKVTMSLGLKTKNICFQSHVESVYYYNLYQPQELWNHQVLLYEYREDGMKSYRMECNKRTTPIVAFIDTENHMFRSPLAIPMEDYLRVDAYRDMDSKFLDIVTMDCQDRLISAVYLLGEGFGGDWMQESLKYLCRNRRVFQGNNLFSKGACYGMLEKQFASENGKSHVFLGNEKLKANIGMKVLRRGEDSYFAILDAGTNWFEAQNEVDFLLESGTSFQVIVTPLNGKTVRAVEISLEGLPNRPAGTTRLRLWADMIGENKVQIRVEDLGFGEIYPATHQKWKEILEI